MAEQNATRDSGTRVHPSTPMVEAAIWAAQRDLAAWEATRRPEAREQFLKVMDDLIPFLCSWAEQFGAGGTPPRFPDDVGVAMRRCLNARNELIGYVPAPPGERHHPGVWHIPIDDGAVALCGYRFDDNNSEWGGPPGTSPGARCHVCDDLNRRYDEGTWTPEEPKES